MELSFKLASFEGPLDLLLFLIQKNKVDIRDIPIAEILRQYLEYMPVIREQNLDNVTEFAVMASTLIYIKSRMLLPKTEEEEEDPRKALADALIEYRKFKEAASWLAARLPDGQLTIAKRPENVDRPRTPDYRHDPGDLLEAMRVMFLRDERRKPPPREAFSGILRQEIVSVEEKSAYIVSILKKLQEIDLASLYYGERDKKHAVAAFLAILDLIRDGVAAVESGKTDGQVLKLCATVMKGT
ncbi:MAG: segregation/condensation protein A [Clostridia bacterium]|nr:segregation/condensation protein A [Clostridia bacterium]